MGSFPDINGWLIATLAFVSAALRAVSEFLLFIHDKTETDLDDKALAKVNGLIKKLASLSGWFGAGKSKKLG